MNRTSRLLMGIIIMAFFSGGFRENESCFKVTTESDKRCKNKRSLEIWLKNTCSKRMDIKLAMQRVDGRPIQFVTKTVEPDDTFTTFICDATSKYKYWVIPTDERKSKKFPTDKEIEEMFQ